MTRWEFPGSVTTAAGGRVLREYPRCIDLAWPWWRPRPLAEIGLASAPAHNKETQMTPTTATLPEPAPPGQATPLTDRYTHVPVTTLVESPLNPRVHFDEAKLSELAASIRERGIVEPLVVRPHAHALPGSPRYEIIAGARRKRAAERIGLTMVPVVIRPYSDEAVLELMLIENLQRDDLDPLEQARGFRALLATNPEKHSVINLATRLGMSPAWVWDRMKLLDLVPEAQALLAAGRISVGHAVVLARLKPEHQARAIATEGGGLWAPEVGTLDLDEEAHADADPYAHLKPKTIRELDAWVATHVRFNVAEMAQAMPLQFDDVAARVARAQAQPGRGRKVVAITRNHHVHPDAKADGERTYGPTSWKRADGTSGTSRDARYNPIDSPRCDQAVLGTVVAGPGYGQVFEVCLAKDTCRVHWAKEIAAKKKADQARTAGTSNQATAKEQRRQQRAEQHLAEEREQEARWEALRPLALRAVAQAIPDSDLTDAFVREVIVNRLTFVGSIDDLEAMLGEPVTVRTFARAWTLVHTVMPDDWSQAAFTPIARTYGVRLDTLARQLTPPAAPSQTPKPAGSRRRRS